MQKMMAEATADFGAADANGDGLLDLAEYAVFHNQQLATWKARGHFVDEREDQVALTFGILDAYNTETPGISLADYLTMMGVWMSKFEALKHTVTGAAAQWQILIQKAYVLNQSEIRKSNQITPLISFIK